MMTVPSVVAIALVVLAAIPSSDAHGRLTKPPTRDMGAGSLAYLQREPITAGSDDPDFNCRGYGAKAPTTTITAGQDVTFQWEFTAAHVGDCAVYISWDAEATWYKIANLPHCKDFNNQDVKVGMPDWLKAQDQAVLRWDWYALHVAPATIEFYAQCVDVKIVNANGGSIPQSGGFSLPNSQLFPRNNYNNDYRSPFDPSDPRNDPSHENAITGPAIAQVEGGSGATTPTPIPEQAPSDDPDADLSVGNCPTNRTHTVQAGETLSRIVAAFEVTLGEVLLLNPAITNPDLINVGDVVCLPNRSQPPTASPSPPDLSDLAERVQKLEELVYGLGLASTKSGVSLSSAVESTAEVMTLLADLKSDIKPGCLDEAQSRRAMADAAPSPLDLLLARRLASDESCPEADSDGDGDKTSMLIGFLVAGFGGSALIIAGAIFHKRRQAKQGGDAGGGVPLVRQ